MSPLPFRKRYERPKKRIPYIVCDVYIQPSATSEQLKEVASRVFSLTVNGALGGVEYDGQLLKRLLDGHSLPHFVTGVEPELEPFPLFIRADRVGGLDLSAIVANALTSKSIREVRLNGKTVFVHDSEPSVDNAGNPESN